MIIGTVVYRETIRSSEQQDFRVLCGQTKEFIHISFVKLAALWELADNSRGKTAKFSSKVNSPSLQIWLVRPLVFTFNYVVPDVGTKISFAAQIIEDIQINEKTYPIRFKYMLGICQL